MGRVDGDLVFGAVAFLDAEVVVVQVDIQIGQDQFLLNEIPDDAGHFIAVEFDDGIGDFDLGHRGLRPLERLNCPLVSLFCGST